MNEMMKRVAEAILARQKAACLEKANRVFDKVDELELARAAIQAMREPTKAMIYAVVDAYDKNPQRMIIDDWQTMIDAALKD